MPRLRWSGREKGGEETIRSETLALAVQGSIRCFPTRVNRRIYSPVCSFASLFLRIRALSLRHRTLHAF